MRSNADLFRSALTKFLLIACFACSIRPELAADETAAPPFYPHKQHLLLWRDADGVEHPVRTADDWSRRRMHVLANMQLVMGEMPEWDRQAPLGVQIVESLDRPGYELRKITYLAEPGDRLPAWLLLPKQEKAANDKDVPRRPAVLCLHQTTKIGKDEPAGLGGSANLHYAQELAERGYVTLAVDYPNFGEYVCDPYALGYASATMKGIRNHRRAVDLLQSLDEVDPERIGAIGHSLGGHNSLFVAAFDERIKCVVSSCGFNSFRHYYQGDLTGWSHRGYMPRIRERYGCDPAQMPFDFTEIVGSLAPRAFLAVAPLEDSNFAVEGVRECIAAARPVYALYGAEDRLSAIYPDGGHDFPPAARRRAYAWLDQHLGTARCCAPASSSGCPPEAGSCTASSIPRRTSWRTSTRSGYCRPSEDSSPATSSGVLRSKSAAIGGNWSLRPTRPTARCASTRMPASTWPTSTRGPI